MGTGLTNDGKWSPSLTLESALHPKGCVVTSQSAVLKEGHWKCSNLADGVYVVDVHSGSPAQRRGRCWVCIGNGTQSMAPILTTLRSKYGESIKPFCENVW